MPTQRMIDATANYIGGATRCKADWDAAFQRSDRGDRLTARDLMEMHAAGLGLIWITHTTDVHSALAVLHLVESRRPTDAGDDPVLDHATRVLEDRVAVPH